MCEKERKERAEGEEKEEKDLDLPDPKHLIFYERAI